MVDLNLYEHVKEFTKEGGLSGAAKGAAIGAGSCAIFNAGAIASSAALGISAASFTIAAPAILGIAAAGAVYGIFKKRD